MKSDKIRPEIVAGKDARIAELEALVKYYEHEMEKDTAGCRALYRIYIVGGIVYGFYLSKRSSRKMGNIRTLGSKVMKRNSHILTES